MSIRVLIVDDSAIVRSVLARELGRHGDIAVIGVAQDPLEAADQIERLNPDVVTLDINMPRMDGITFLRGLMRHRPIPVVMVSTLTQQGSHIALTALQLGAADFVAKPGAGQEVKAVADELAGKIRAAAQARWQSAAEADPAPRAGVTFDLPPGLAERTVIAIGASTGGTRAIEVILKRLPADGPGIVMVQHMPPYFTRLFAERLDALGPIEVREAQGGETVRPGLALLAPGGAHMALHRAAARYHVTLEDGPRVNQQKPAVDVLFFSVAKAAGENAVGVILTGMGSDGARGLLAMHRAGAATIAQDGPSSVVNGMPGEAVRLGAAKKVASLDRIPEALKMALEART
jgi:two-component system chemotaxis response regulator CheB